MEPIRITYRIKLNDKITEVFDFDLDSKTFALITKPVPNPPKWAELGFRQCSHCPLKAEEHPHCPMALQLHSVIERFHKTRSIDEVTLEVVTEERIVSQNIAMVTRRLVENSTRSNPPPAPSPSGVWGWDSLTACSRLRRAA